MSTTDIETVFGKWVKLLERNILQFLMEYYLQNSTTYSQQKGRRGLKTEYMVQVGDEGDAFADHER